ncbi:MAG: hypothetical protein A3G04_01700, partial [Candidatus Taylorbacteria bacterium RIFCSPLOWO2_12_FULL_44_9]
MKALVYLRVSTDKQAIKGLSIPTQKESCLDFAKKEGYEVEENNIFTDSGESARTSDRPEFQRLLEHCRKDKDIRAVIVYDISRFSRNGVEYYVIKQELEKLGISILSVSEPIEPIEKGGSPATWLMEWILAGFAEFRSRQDAQKILAGMKRKAQEGVYPTRAPFGYRNRREVISGDKNRAWIELDQKEAVWVEKVFQLYSTGNYSLRGVVDILWLEGFPSRTGKKPHFSFIDKMLKNKAYIGWVVWDGVENPNGKHQAIISKGLFDKVQGILEAHNVGADRKRKHAFILRGVAYCGECGSRWTAGFHSNGTSKKYGLYSCQKAQRSQRIACQQESIDIDELEKQFAKILKKVQLPNAFVEKIRERVRSLFAQEEQIYQKMRKVYLDEETKLKEQQRRLIKLYMNSGLTDEQYEQEKKALETEETRIKENGAKVELELKDVVRTIEIAIGLANNCYRAYQKSPYELKILLAHAFFQKLVIKDKQIVQAVLNPPLDYLCANR